jgi:hypothetical protein
VLAEVLKDSTQEFGRQIGDAFGHDRGAMCGYWRLVQPYRWVVCCWFCRESSVGVLAGLARGRLRGDGVGVAGVVDR